MSYYISSISFWGYSESNIMLKEEPKKTKLVSDYLDQLSVIYQSVSCNNFNPLISDFHNTIIIGEKFIQAFQADLEGTKSRYFYTSPPNLDSQLTTLSGELDYLKKNQNSTLLTAGNVRNFIEHAFDLNNQWSKAIFENEKNDIALMPMVHPIGNGENPDKIPQESEPMAEEIKITEQTYSCRLFCNIL